MSGKMPVGVLGATGAVGQKFIKLLEGHPWFEVTEVAASERTSGKLYGDAVSWKQVTPIPEAVQPLQVRPCTPDLKCRIVFSGLDANVAGQIEEDFARAGYIVLSNSKNHRLDEDVPLVIPEVNPEHLGLIPIQRQNRKSTGYMVTNANCTTMFLAMALGPIHKAFKVEKVFMVSVETTNDKKQVALSANVVEGEKPESPLAQTDFSQIRRGLEIGAIVLIVLVVILGLIIGFNKLKGNEEEPEEVSGQTYY